MNELRCLYFTDEMQPSGHAKKFRCELPEGHAGYHKYETPVDYSAFSSEALVKSIREILDNVKRETGATEEEVLAALAVAGRKIMDVNCLALE